MRRILLILCTLMAALLCRLAAVPDAHAGTAADPAAAVSKSCGELSAAGAPDSSMPGMLLEQHSASGVLTGKSRSYSNCARRLQSAFRNIFFRGGETVIVCGTELHYLNMSCMPPVSGEKRSIPVFLRNLRN